MKTIKEYLESANESQRIDEFLLTAVLATAIIGYGFAPVWKSGWKAMKSVWDNHFSREARLKKLEDKINRIEKKERDKKRLKELKEKEKEYKRIRRENFKKKLKSLFGFSKDQDQDQNQDNQDQNKDQNKDQDQNQDNQDQNKDQNKDQDQNQDNQDQNKDQNNTNQENQDDQEDTDFDDVYDWWRGQENQKDQKDKDKEDWKNTKDDRSDDEKSKDVIVTTINILDQNKTDNIDEQKTLHHYKNILSSTVFDENGDVIPLKDREKKLKDVLPNGTDIDEFKKSMEKHKEQLKDPKIMDSFEKAISKVDTKSLENTEKDVKERSKNVWEKKKKGEKISDEEDKLIKDLTNTTKDSDKVEKDKDSDKVEKDKDSDEVEKDEEGNILKKETVKDKDGKEIHVVTHTGPRGGKWYKNSEGNKTYVQESLKMYIIRKL